MYQKFCLYNVLNNLLNPIRYDLRLIGDKLPLPPEQPRWSRIYLESNAEGADNEDENEEDKTEDELVEDHDVKIVIDAKAVLFLIGTVVDFETTLLHEKFVFRNPNQTDACGCGESVTIQPAVAS